MKDRKKPQGTGAAVRAYKKRLRRIGLVITIAAFIIIAISGFLIYSSFYSSSNQPNTDQILPLKAAIIDNICLYESNQTFIETATAILKAAGFTVDYYKADEVTVEFYRNLPARGYSLIILRVHSSAAILQGKEFVECSVGIFSSEPYSTTKYVYEQITDQLLIASYNMPEPPYFFAITPKFVTYSMNGKFPNTTIIMMGCEGLHNPLLAQAFIEKGAKVYVGWNGSIGIRDDPAIERLLRHLIAEKLTVRDAVMQTNNELGPDPEYDSALLFYPDKAEDYVVPNAQE